MLRLHAKFFDLNNDEILSNDEIYQGMQQLKAGPVLSFVAAVGLPLLLGLRSGGSLTTINLSGINNLIHAPDHSGGFNGTTIVYKKDIYTRDDIKQLIIENGGRVNPVTFALEWDLLFSTLAKFRTLTNDQGVEVITKQEMIDFFNGTLFYKLANRPIPT